MGRKLLILHDSPDFGGHERMLLALLPELVGDNRFDEIVFCLPACNTRLRNALAALSPVIRVISWPFVKQRAEPYLAGLRWRYRRAVRRLVDEERPDTILLVQGRIENLAVPMTVLGDRARVVSYIPMAHRMSVMGRSGLVGDRVRRRLYARPDQYIVPSPSVAEQVRDAGGIGPISVAHNVVQPPPRRGKTVARLSLGLPKDRRVALYLGRLDTVQKGLDLLAGAIARAGPEALSGWTFVFVGEGPGRGLIEDLQRTAGVDVRLVAWTDEPGSFLSAADVLLMPSRFEGLPLVMLEAMHYGLPVLASDIDVARDYLPAGNIANFASIDLPEMLEGVASPDAVAAFGQHAATRLADHTLEGARASFADALAA